MKSLTWHIAYCAALMTTFAGQIKAEETESTKEEVAETGREERKTKALSFLGSLKIRGAEGEEKQEAEHVEVGNRSLSHAEWVKGQEAKEKIATARKNRAEGKEGVEKRSLESVEPSEEAVEDVTNAEIIAKPTYYTSHQGAMHRPIAVTVLGDIVTLEDGSEWIVKYSHRYKTLDWLASDSILVLPNHAWFSSYYFRLVNQMTGADIEVNLLKGPIYNGVYTHWIIAIDYLNCELCLEDGSIWRISSGDYSTMKKWLVNDTIILGINDSWLSSKPNILLNVNMLNYVSGICENGF
ncbi:cell envelope integrity protein TolA [Estrella lausannensis]|uniref:Conserved putative secreted protein n=1 Tax=Estrella lausannensis TaxID=483423 RepID=A0A0H5DTR3_9BACT|nr:hypothetical protein [Estrella lausannensis]CRX39269.1 Conserved putative secreted protein [Estrella lausannensis]